MNKSNNVAGIIERIKQRRMELGLSYQELADRTSLSKSTLQRYETGNIANIPLSKIEILANGLETTPEYIMGWKQKTNCNESSELEGIYFRLGKEAQEMELDEEDIENILNLYRKHRKNND